MQPRQDVRAEAPGCAIASLPHALLLRIFALLPADCRLRCGEVCAAWHRALGESSLWARLDLTAENGGVRGATDALLRTAAARAAGGLTALDVSGCAAITRDAVLGVVAHAGALRALRSLRSTLLWTPAQLEALLRAAPLLPALHADVTCDAEAARALLRNEAPYERLRVQELRLTSLDSADDASPHDVLVALRPHMAAHASLTGLACERVALDVAGALAALVQAAEVCRLSAVRLQDCRLPDNDWALLVAELLGNEALTTLQICNSDAYHNNVFDLIDAQNLADALRDNITLTSLRLTGVGVWRSVAAGMTLMVSLVRHPSLREIAITAERHAGAGTAAGSAYGMLIAADAPALQALDVSSSSLADNGLLELFSGLPRNKSLRCLDCSGNGTTISVLRCVEDNTSLRQLFVDTEDVDSHGATVENEELALAVWLVSSRT
jgi:hypothetical protein